MTKLKLGKCGEVVESKLTPADLDRIKADAEKATPGKLTATKREDGWGIGPGCAGTPRHGRFANESDAKHFANFDRDTTLALIELARRGLENADG